MNYDPLHTIPEGYIGVYQTFGAMTKADKNPGLKIYNPLWTKIHNVQVTLQTDKVIDIPCGTKEGINISFNTIEVDNILDKEKAFNTIKMYGVDYDKKWIFAKINHEINQFCSSHTLQEVYIDMFSQIDESLAKALQHDCDKFDTGINIISIRVTKPVIPDGIAKNYKELSKQKTEMEIQRREFELSKMRNNRMRMDDVMKKQLQAELELMEAEKVMNISMINELKITKEKEEQAKREALVSKLKQNLLTYERKMEQERNNISIAIFKSNKTAEIEISKTNKTAELEATRKTLEIEIDSFIKKEKFKSEVDLKRFNNNNYMAVQQTKEISNALKDNTKFYFGDKLPDFSNLFAIDLFKKMFSSKQPSPTDAVNTM